MGTPISIAAAALVRNGLVLMVHRHPRRQAYPDRWGLPGGHLESGELSHEAVSRECLEEIGVHVHDPQPIPMVVVDTSLDMTAFLVTRWTGEPVNAALEEHDDLRWFSPRDLAQLELAHPETLPNILNAIQSATESSDAPSLSGRDDRLVARFAFRSLAIGTGADRPYRTPCGTVPGI